MGRSPEPTHLVLLWQLALGYCSWDVLRCFHAHTAGGHVVACAPCTVALLGTKVETVTLVVVVTARGWGLGLLGDALLQSSAIGIVKDRWIVRAVGGQLCWVLALPLLLLFQRRDHNVSSLQAKYVKGTLDGATDAGRCAAGIRVLPQNHRSVVVAYSSSS